MSGLNELVEAAAQSPKVGMAVGGGTITSGIGALLELLPSGATIVTFSGAVLSLVLAWNHWKRGKLERSKLRLELELLKRELENNGH